ncbi:PD40 domain-containing protein [bacterium]|nr:PD40 domain-containing protein [bacterium]
MKTQFTVLLAFLVLCCIQCTSVYETDLTEAIHIPAFPKTDPDYHGAVLPQNIAPVNFMVAEEGNAFLIRISGKHGSPIKIISKDGRIDIPIKSWKQLVSENAGDTLLFDVFVKKGDYWKHYRPIMTMISPDSIDSYLTYRLINPAYNLWGEMGLYQRCLENFKESPILINRAVDGSCMNCHHPCVQKPENVMMHIRAGQASGTFVLHEGQPMKVNTATEFNRAGAYASWHPGGDLITFSVNSLMIFFHAVGECRDVVDNKSDLIVYDIPKNRVTTCPQISAPERMETFPCWSPDGKSLYFASAPIISQYVIEKNGEEDLAYDKIFYDLNRVSYDPETGTWGEVETLYSGEEHGLSAVMPRVSPDGRFLLFTVSDYGSFPIYLKSADLMLMDLASGAVRCLDINSDQTDSHHAWSSTSRWVVFSSKRRDGLLARPHFCHVDKSGNFSKPFVLPQKDPAFYDHFLKTYNVPELARLPVQISPQKIIRVMNNNAKRKNADLDPVVKSRLPDKEKSSKDYQTAPG